MDMDIETTVEGNVTCPECGHVFKAKLTGETTITTEPLDYHNEGYD